MVNDIYNLNVGDVIEKVDLSYYTTYKIKAVGRVLVIPRNIDCLKKLISYIKGNNIKYKVIGNGSNLIFTQSFYDGVLIKLNCFNSIDIDDCSIEVGAGYSLIKLALKACGMGLSGFEFACGIPGSVGGSVYMNAGAYNCSISDVLESAVVLDPDLNIVTFSNSDFKFGYRSSFLQSNPGFVCLSARFRLKKGNKDEIMDLVNDRRLRRISSQPLEFPSAGSVFRNPQGDFAGRLIEEIGYKGMICGGAQVSMKHANFIINIGGATGSDVRNLIFDIKSKVKERYNIDLKVEQEFVE